MKFMTHFVVVIILLAVACVGMHLYIVEGELNEVRQAQFYNTEIFSALEYGGRGLRFAETTQYIALMAEERASELAYKLDVAAAMVSSLEEHLTQATATVESQCVTIKDLIDQNSELQNDNQWISTQLESTQAKLTATAAELEEALISLDETILELEEAKQTLSDELGVVIAELGKAKKFINELMGGVVSYPPMPPVLFEPDVVEPEIIQPENFDVE